MSLGPNTEAHLRTVELFIFESEKLNKPMLGSSKHLLETLKSLLSKLAAENGITLRSEQEMIQSYKELEKSTEQQMSNKPVLTKGEVCSGPQKMGLVSQQVYIGGPPLKKGDAV